MVCPDETCKQQQNDLKEWLKENTKCLGKKVEKKFLMWAVGACLLVAALFTNSIMASWSAERIKVNSLEKAQVSTAKDIEHIKEASVATAEQLKSIDTVQHQILETLIKIDQTMKTIHPNRAPANPGG